MAVVRIIKILGNFFWKTGDGALINRMGPDGMAFLSDQAGRILSRFQTGYIYHYAFVMLVGIIAFVSWVVFNAGLE